MWPNEGRETMNKKSKGTANEADGRSREVKLTAEESKYENYKGNNGWIYRALGKVTEVKTKNNPTKNKVSK